ncbi:putative ribonuclease H-like domain-containing protein [Tanacetum coccineum]
MRPFRCPFTILNSLDHLGKFDGKADEGFFVRYSTNSKAYMVFNSRTRIVEENLHVKFSEETPNIAGNGPNWLFDIDALTISMNYKPVVTMNQTNGNAGTKENIDAGQAGKKIVPDQEYILLPLLTSIPSLSKSSKNSSDARFKPSGEEEKIDSKHLKNKDSEVPNTEEPIIHQDQDANVNSTNNINIVCLTVNAADIKNNVVDENIVYGCIDDPSMTNLEEIVYSGDDKEVGAEADMNNLATTVPVSPIPTIRVHKDHPLEQIIGDIHSAPQTRRMTKKETEHVEPKKVIQALTDPSWIEAIHDELLKFKSQKVWTLVDLPYGKRAIGTKWVYRNKKDDRGIVVRNKARLMDVKSAFLYGTIEEEVYVCQPPGFEDPEFPNKVYKVEKALYGLHQAPRAWTKMISYDAQDIPDEFYGGTHFLLRVAAITPMETNKALLKDEEAANVDVYLYISMIRSLMYLTTSRPDIMFTVCSCSRFQVIPKTSHLHAMKRIFRYLKGHPKLGLWYPRDSPFDLEAFSDSDYDGASLDRKSTTGEYVDAANCSGQNPVFHSKTKHIEIRHHFIRDSYEKRLIQVIKIHTDHNVADLLTKAFDVSRFQYLIARYLEWNGTAAKDEFQVSAVRVTYYWQVYLMLLVAFNTVVKIKNVEPIKQKWVKDRMKRAATTASSLEAKQDSGNINRTQSMATLNESFPQGTNSGSGPRCQDTILGLQKLKFDLRLHLNKSYDPPLSRVNILRSGEDSIKLKEKK